MVNGRRVSGTDLAPTGAKLFSKKSQDPLALPDRPGILSNINPPRRPNMPRIDNKTATPMTEADAKNVADALNGDGDDWTYVVIHMTHRPEDYEHVGGTKEGRFAADFGNAYNVAVFDESHEFTGFL